MILIFSILDDLEKQRDIEIQEENEERRAEALRKTIEDAKLLQPNPDTHEHVPKRIIRRRLIKDTDGKILAEEIIEEEQ